MNCSLPVLVLIAGLYLNPREIKFKQHVNEGCLVVMSGTRPAVLVNADCLAVDRAIEAQLKNLTGRVHGKLPGRTRP